MKYSFFVKINKFWITRRKFLAWPWQNEGQGGPTCPWVDDPDPDPVQPLAQGNHNRAMKQPHEQNPEKSEGRYAQIEKGYDVADAYSATVVFTAVLFFCFLHTVYTFLCNC